MSNTIVLQKIKSNETNTKEYPYNGTFEEIDRTNLKSCPNKGLNAFNNKYINAELENSATPYSQKKSTSKKNFYTSNFEIIWNRYDKKSSNKARSQTIYNRRWKDSPIELILQAIDKYKSSIDLTYLKDFDKFLDGMIDSYIPAKVWIVDKENKKHIGYFYDNENLFISDENLKLQLESSNIALYIASKRFGYMEG